MRNRTLLRTNRLVSTTSAGIRSGAARALAGVLLGGALLVPVAARGANPRPVASPCGDFACPDHLLCYKVKPAKAPSGAPPFPTFVPQAVAVTDRLGGPFGFALKKPLTLCNPRSCDAAMRRRSEA